MSDLWWAGAGILGGLGLLVAGGELLVRGASRLAAALRVSPLVIGLTVVAFGTSTPELAVSVQAALGGSSDLALGNVVGSNVFNVLFILGISALIVPLAVSSQLIRWDVPVMIVVSLMVAVVGWDETIGRSEGALLFAGIVAYTWWCIRQSPKQDPEVQTEFAHEWGSSPFRAGTMIANLAWIAAGLGLLAVGSRLLVAGSVRVAEGFGVSELVIGLTIVAAGTSLPEVVTSIVAAIRGERDIAVGNVVGSNIFNVLCVLGLSGLIAPSGIHVGLAALEFDIPVMIAVAVACLPIFFTGHVISRWEGGLFFGYYLLYTTYLVLDASGNDLGTALGNVIVLFVAPLTAITLAVALWRTLQCRTSPEGNT